MLLRPEGGGSGSWQELDRGPGYFHIPPGMEVGVRIRQSDDENLEEIFEEIRSCGNITHLNISENRKVTDDGLKGLIDFPHLTELNLSSCDITDDIFSILAEVIRIYASSTSAFATAHLRYRD